MKWKKKNHFRCCFIFFIRRPTSNKRKFRLQLEPGIEKNNIHQLGTLNAVWKFNKIKATYSIMVDTSTRSLIFFVHSFPNACASPSMKYPFGVSRMKYYIFKSITLRGICHLSNLFKKNCPAEVSHFKTMVFQMTDLKWIRGEVEPTK